VTPLGLPSSSVQPPLWSISLHPHHRVVVVVGGGVAVVKTPLL